MKRANEHLEQLCFWHEVTKPKLMTAQVTWLMNLQLKQASVCVPSMPIELNNVIVELLAELDMAQAIVKVATPPFLSWAYWAALGKF